MRRSAILRALVGFVVAAIFFAFGRIIVSLVVGGIATLTLVLGLASPLGIYARLDALIEKAGELAAKVLGWLLLAPLFYGFFLPFGLLFRRGAKDPMARSFDRDRDSYWEDREGARSLDKPY